MTQNELITDPLADRNTQLKQLFTLIYPQLSQAVYDRHPQMEAPFHGELMTNLAGLLRQYKGTLTEDGLLTWAESLERTDPDIWLLCTHADCQPFIYSAIWKTLGHSTEPSKYDDYPETVQELATDTWVWVLEHVSELMTPGSAKLSTRLYAQAQFIAKAWIKKQRTRRAAVIRHIYDLPSKAAAQKMAQALDEEAIKRASEERESAEIRVEMETALAAA